MVDKQAAFRALPSVESVLKDSLVQELLEAHGRSVITDAIRVALGKWRHGIQSNDSTTIERITATGFQSELIEEISGKLRAAVGSTLKPVFNLTGTVIHTNLGRAKLPIEAVLAMETAAMEAANLEYDIKQGKRGDRDSHLEAIICELTGAEAATVVNNNAAAVLLVLSTLAKGRDVLISRGELVEIGGSFRIPAVMESAGCNLKEVGTTNRTHLQDFATAIDQNTALLMQVHTSNYEIQGFTKAVPAVELAELAKQQGLPLVCDLGSGTLVNLSQYNLPYETTVQDELAAGAEVVTFSGDKLLGGPQAGVIVGAGGLIERIKQNPLKRALRVDKVTLAALLQVLNLYRDPDTLQTRLPVIADLSRAAAEIQALCERLCSALTQRLADKAEVSIEACKSQIGSGSLPTDVIDSFALAIRPLAEKGARDATLQQLSAAFRALPKPVIGRIHNGVLLFDLRCLRDEDSFLQQLPELNF